MARCRISDNRRWVLDKNGNILMGLLSGQMWVHGPDPACPFPNHPHINLIDPDTNNYPRPPYTNWVDLYFNSAYDGNITREFLRNNGRVIGYGFSPLNIVQGWTDITTDPKPIFCASFQSRLQRVLNLCEETDTYLIFILLSWWSMYDNDSNCTPFKYLGLSSYNTACGEPVPYGPFPSAADIVNNPPNPPYPPTNRYARAQYNYVKAFLELIMSMQNHERLLGVQYCEETETATDQVGNYWPPAENTTITWRYFISLALLHRMICYEKRNIPGWWRPITGDGPFEGDPGILEFNFYCESTGDTPNGPESWVESEFLAHGPMFVGVTNYIGGCGMPPQHAFLFHQFDFVLGPNSEYNPNALARLSYAYNLGLRAPLRKPAFLAYSRWPTSPYYMAYHFLRLPENDPALTYDGRYGFVCRWYEYPSGCAHQNGVLPYCTRWPTHDEEYNYVLSHPGSAGGQFPPDLAKYISPECPYYTPFNNDYIAALVRVYAIGVYLDGGAMAQQWHSDWLSPPAYCASKHARMIGQKLTQYGAHYGTTTDERIHNKISILSGPPIRKTGTLFRRNDGKAFAFCYFVKENPAQTTTEYKITGLPTGGTWYYKYLKFNLNHTITEFATGAVIAAPAADGYQVTFSGQSALTFDKHDALVILQNWPLDDPVPPPPPGNQGPIVTYSYPAPGSNLSPDNFRVVITWQDEDGINPQSFELYIKYPGQNTYTRYTSSSGGMSVEVSETSMTFTFIRPGGWPTGQYWAYSNCADELGNTSSYGLNVWQWTLSSSPGPIFSDLVPPPGASGVSPNTVVSSKLTGNFAQGLNSNNLRLTVDGNIIPFSSLNITQPQRGTWNIVYIPPSPFGFGQHTVYWWARDDAGQIGYANYQFTVSVSGQDITPPTCISVTPPANAIVLPTNIVKSKWRDMPGSITELPSGINISSVVLKIDNSPEVYYGPNGVTANIGMDDAIEYVYTGATQLLVPGTTHTITWKVKDNANNQGIKTYTCRIAGSAAPPPPVNNFRVQNIYYVNSQMAHVTLAWDPMAPEAANGLILLQKAGAAPAYLPNLGNTMPSPGQIVGDGLVVMNTNIGPSWGTYTLYFLNVGETYWWYIASWKFFGG